MNPSKRLLQASKHEVFQLYRVSPRVPRREELKEQLQMGPGVTGQESQKVFVAVALLSTGSVGSWEEAKGIQAQDAGGGGCQWELGKVPEPWRCPQLAFSR